VPGVPSRDPCMHTCKPNQSQEQAAFQKQFRGCPNMDCQG